MKAKFLFPLLVCLAGACAKQMPAESEAMPAQDRDAQVYVELQAVRQSVGEGKTHIDGLSPVWDSTDRLSVFGSSSSNAEFLCASATGKNATFYGTTDATGPYTAIFPYRADNAVSGTSATITVPAVQQLSGSQNVAPDAMVGIATAASVSDNLAFKNVTALVKVTVPEDGVITSILLSTGGAPLAGTATVASATAELQSVAEGSSIVTLLPASETFSPGDYYIAVLPCSSEGIAVSVRHKEDARRGDKSSLKTFTTVRNKILNLGSLASGGLDWAYRIYNCQDLFDYAADDANWSIEEDINVCADIDMECRPWHTLDDRLAVYGTFEGNGHCIYNIKIEESDMQYVGFFGRYYKNISNLILGSKDGVTYDGVSSVTNNYASEKDAWTYTSGCIIWPGEKRVIENVTNFSAVTTTAACTHKSRSAGVVTWIESAEGVVVRGCKNYGTITTVNNAGSDDNINSAGIVSGVNTINVLIEDCHNYGKITSSHIYAHCLGGIVGQTYSAASLVMKNCTNDGEISIETSATHKHEVMIGGIIGRPICKAGATPVRISGCVNNGRVYTNAVYYCGVGGIAGWAQGAYIEDCINTGSVEDKSTSGRYQAVGGIVGICGDGYGSNTVKNCVNKGDVLFEGKSFGMTANTSKGEVRGVTAGGIVGLAAFADEISGNENHADVTGINNYVGTKSYPKAYMFAGGIVGWDFATIGTFENNKTMLSATVTAKTTDSSSSYTTSHVYCGGIIGYQKTTTMLSGMTSATVVASYASATGDLYAGTVAGWNRATISMCHYGGSVNGVGASESNIVGRGNAPVAAAPASASQTDNYDGGLGDVNSENGNWD